MKSHGLAILFLISAVDLSFVPVFAQSVQSLRTSLSGVILDDITGKAIANAEIRLTPSGSATSTVAGADADGSFRYLDISPGWYHLSAVAPGYFPENTNIEIRVGSESRVHKTVLTAKRKLAGTISWSDGEPAVDATLTVLESLPGRLNLLPNTVTANDRGEFNIPNLRPGRYVVYAVPPRQISRDPLGQFINSLTRPALPVSYPSDVSGNVRLALDLANVGEILGLTLTLEEQSAMSLDGVVNPSIRLPLGTPVTIHVVPNDSLGPFEFSTSSRTGELFRLKDIPVGSYTLIAEGVAGGQYFYGIQPVFISRGNSSSLQIDLTEAKSIIGVVESPRKSNKGGGQDEGQSSSVTGIGIWAKPKQMRTMPQIHTQPNENGEFVLRRVFSSESYYLEITSIPPGMYVAEISQGGLELSSVPLSATGSSDTLRVVLKDDGGTIAGQVRNSESFRQPLVVLIPVSPVAEYRFLSAVPDSEGSYRLPNVAPGDYYLVAIERNEAIAYFDEDFVLRYLDRALTVRVEASHMYSMSLYATKAEAR